MTVMSVPAEALLPPPEPEPPEPPEPEVPLPEVPLPEVPLPAEAEFCPPEFVAEPTWSPLAMFTWATMPEMVARSLAAANAACAWSSELCFSATCEFAAWMAAVVLVLVPSTWLRLSLAGLEIGPGGVEGGPQGRGVDRRP